MREAFALVLGYLLGSVLPAYLIGRARGIDLRVAGGHNAGTTNAYHTLGLWPAVMTAFYDTLKGLLAMAVAWGLLGVTMPWVYASGLAAVLGHRFPFYLRFRGALGMATTSGLGLYALFTSVARGWIPLEDFVVLGAMTAGLAWIFGKWAPTSLLVTPIVLGLTAYRCRDVAFLVFFGVVLAYIWAVNLWQVRKDRMLAPKAETKTALSHSRVLMRPAAVAFPVLYLFLDKQVMLLLVGSVTLFFVTVDVVRLLSRRVNAAVFDKASFFFRSKEERSFSSASLFLVGSFLTLFLFSRPVASVALLFNTFGDMAAKYAGIQHGRTHIFSRTLEGSLAYFIACAAVGAAWAWVSPLTLPQYLVGAAAASLTELAPTHLDDNFTVPVMSGVAMTLPAFFHVAGF